MKNKTMPNQKQKNRALATGIILVLSQFLASVPMVSAQSTANAYTKCDEGIHPFDPAKPEATDGDADANYINFPGESHCFSNLTGSFPWDQHVDPDPGTHNPKSSAKSVPKAKHEHHYINESDDGDGWYKRAWLKTFKIHLQSDLKSIKKDHSLKCPIPDDGNPSHYDTNFGNCDAGSLPFNYTNSKVFGGTSLNYDGTTLTYTFGLNSAVEDPPGSGNWYVKPIMPGKNPEIDQGIFFPGDTTLWQTRAFSMAIDFETKNMSPDTAWSGTSTSEAEVIHTAIPKSAFNSGKLHACTEGGSWNASNSWCNVGGYQWVNVATVASVWKSTTPPPPPTCDNLILKPMTLNDTGATAMTAQVVVTGGSVHTANILWTPTGGTMSAGNTQSGNTGTSVTAQKIANTYNLADPNVGGSVKAKVTSIADGVVIPLGGTCDKGVEVKTPPITPDCTGLSISPTGPFTEMDIPTSTPGKTITVTSSTKGGLSLSYKWESSVPGLIKFDGNPGTYIDLNKTTDLTRTGAVTSPVTVTVTGVNASNTAEAFGPPHTPVCQRKITINPPPKPYCEYIAQSKLTLSNTSSDTFSATVHYNDGTDRVTEVTWTPTNLNLTPATNPESHSSATPFTKNTNPQVPGSPVALNAKVTKVPAGVDNSPACQTGVTASSGGGNECLNLNNSGYTGTTVTGGSSPVLLAPNPTNVVPPPPPQVTWTVSGSGWLIRNNWAFPFDQEWMCPATLSNTSISLPRGCQYWYYTTGNTNDSGFVTITANPNLGNKAACTQTTSFNNNPQNNVCTLLTTSFPPGQVCVAPNVAVPGYNWTVNGVGQSNHTNCQNITSTDSWYVVAQGAPSCQAQYTPPPNNNQCNYVTPSYNGTDLCLNVNGNYNGNFTWQIGGGAPFPNGLCQPVAPDTIVNVTGPNPACSLTNYKTPPHPPKFEKSVRAINTPESSQGPKYGTSPLTLVPNIDGKTVEYKLVFTPASASPTTVTITDDISKGYIQGKTNTGADGGRIVYNDNMNVSVPFCGTGKFALTSGCYTGDIGTPSGITLLKVSGPAPVTITYQGKVTGSLLTEANCKDSSNNICQEKYPNMASANYAVYPDISSTTPSETGLLNASAIVQSFCQYILTRAAGDIYLETDLNFGKDIRLCTDYTSSTGLIVTPGPEVPPGAPSTGPGTVPIGHEVCSQGLTISPGGTTQKVYGEDAASKYLSSQICEVKLRPGESWSKSTIDTSIQENKTRVSRWEPNLDTSGINTISSFDDSALPATNTGVYHITNGNLVVGSGSDVVLHDGQGAKTFIVEGHDLVIKNNIKYGDCNKPSGTCTVRDTASLAFIVLGGNVVIDPSVTEVAGVFFVQQGAPNSDTGKLKALGDGDSYSKLTIYGSVYGDIQELFTHHKFAGDPAANDGSVVIRFDERIILNTPPGLQDLLQLSQSEVAR